MTRRHPEPRVPRNLPHLFVEGWVPSPGEVVEVVMRHDDDCPRLRGGACRCEPEVEVVAVDGKRVVHA